jgi:hypothetical protein
VTIPATSQPPSETPPNPVDLLKSRGYLALLLFGAIIGVPVAVVAYFLPEGVAESQHCAFTALPNDLGFDGEPIWWPRAELTARWY